MTTSSRSRRLLAAVAAIGVSVIFAVPASASPSLSAGGSGQSGYNAIPSKVSENVPSWGFEATATTEFGDEVNLGGSGRSLESMSVLLSSWGCQSGTWYGRNCVTTAGATFEVPVTFTIYEDVYGTPGAVLASRTETATIAYRPSASPECTGDDAGKWFNPKDRTCYNGLPQTVEMAFDGTTLPDQVIWSVSYNTSHYGHPAVGEEACFFEDGGCGYDALNVGAFSYPKAPFSGWDTNEDEAFVNGSMQADWTGFRPLASIVTK